MNDRLIDFLLRRAPRERWLIGCLVVVVLPLALALGWLLPLAEERRAAQAALEEARALEMWVLARQDEMAGFALPRKNPVGTGPALGASALEQSLIARNLRSSLSALETRGDGEVALRFDAVNFVDLMRWMDAEDPDWGYRISDLRLERTERSAMVEARLTLLPIAPD
jgi:type II secretory pathway component PulM